MENVRFHYCKVNQLTGVNPCSQQAVHLRVWKPNCLWYNVHQNVRNMGGLSQRFILG